MDDTEQPIDRSKVTFSQAEGIEPLPTPLALGELSQQARSLIWTVIYNQLKRYSEESDYEFKRYLLRPWKDILYIWYISVIFKPADEFSDNFEDHIPVLKKLIWNAPYNKVFDFLQFIMRHKLCPDGLAQQFEFAFKESRSAYAVISDNATIIPIATPEEGQAITEAFVLSKNAGFKGANAHLQKAAEFLNQGNSSDSIRESIHAVESVARRLNSDASTTLGPALTTLEKHTALHPALKAGFIKIYNYTSDEKGIRHSLIEDKADVDMTDATFMFGACASFITYLINKARQSGLSV